MDEPILTKACEAGVHRECGAWRNSKKTHCDCTCHKGK